MVARLGGCDIRETFGEYIMTLLESGDVQSQRLGLSVMIKPAARRDRLYVDRYGLIRQASAEIYESKEQAMNRGGQWETEPTGRCSIRMTLLH
jgi:hypothetical protein